ncbi:vitamin K epoxide reductase family protein [Sorangium sp. So ce363]|uniref:vitamin K epoxide reductase family protein n=1 Tax=Sorangium sp. So ce363 TaxID=3133304 RepID=UPI003F605D5A
MTPRTHLASDPTSLNVPAPPWHYNPSSWGQRVPICLLAAVGFVLSSYMALYQWRLISSVWDPFFGEQTLRVLDSGVSHQMRRWFGVPDAALGAIAYLGDAIFGLAGCTRRWQYRPWLVVLFGLDVIPLGAVSVVLVVLQGTVVGAWCSLCIATAIVSLVLILLAYDEVWSSLSYLVRVWRHTHQRRAVSRMFWGRPSPGGDDAALIGGRA